MNVQRRNFLLLVTLAGAAATPTWGQPVAPTVGPSDSGTHSAASIPDFSGIWFHPFLPGFELPLSGAGPVVNKSRRRQLADADGRPVPAASGVLVSNPSQLVGDYTNPILKPEAAEVVKFERGEQHKQIGGAVALILVIITGRAAGFHRHRHAGLGNELL
jgi:hypothetical protein